jgi:DNA-binding response OmpR family regulator
LKKPQVLCIDRYETLLATTKIMLTQAGYEVLTASSVAAGLSCLAQNPVNAVILDYSLCGHKHEPGCIADRIRALREGVKLLVWCADDSIYRDKPPCADATFMKPTPPDQLLAQLDSLLRPSLNIAA